MNGREPYLTAAQTILRESGCTVAKWRTGMGGVARVRDPDWAIECPEPRGPISYAVLAHEVAHQLLHRTGSLPRWREELEAWLWAIDTFERFDLPGVERVRADAVKYMNHAVHKSLRRSRTSESKRTLARQMVAVLPEWMLDVLAPLDHWSEISTRTDDSELTLAREK